MRQIQEFHGANAQGKTVNGIYKLDGDVLTVCFDRAGAGQRNLPARRARPLFWKYANAKRNRTTHRARECEGQDKRRHKLF